MPSDKVSDPSGQEAGDSLRKALELVGKIVAPTTVLSALLYYFGWARANAIYGYFGIDQSLLGFSTADYLMRSIVAAFEPLRWSLILSLAAIWFDHWFRSTLTRQVGKTGSRRMGWIVGIVLGVGLLSLLGGPAVFLISLPMEPLFFSASWVAGVALTAFGARLWLHLKTVREAEEGSDGWASMLPEGIKAMTTWLVVAMLCFSLFWFVSMYADVVGRWEAGQLAGRLDERPCVDVYSRTPLNLESRSIETEEMSADKEAYRYRYSGLRFLVRSADRFFLLPEAWSEENAHTIIIRDSDEIRVEVMPGRFCTP
jgi:hypothetical protein